MGEACHVSGWGREIWNNQGSGSTILKEAGVSIMSHNYCEICTTRKFYHSAYDSNRFEVMESLEFCAGTLDRNGDGMIDGGDNICKGDSGGPVTCVRNGQPELAGVTSWASRCGQFDGSPSVYVNVMAYLKWIKQTAGWNKEWGGDFDTGNLKPTMRFQILKTF